MARNTVELKYSYIVSYSQLGHTIIVNGFHHCMETSSSQKAKTSYPFNLFYLIFALVIPSI